MIFPSFLAAAAGWAVLAILCPHTLVSARDVSQRHSSAPPPRPTVKTVPHKNDHRNPQCVKFKLLHYTPSVFNGHCPSNRSRWFKNTQYYTLWCEPKHCPILWINKCEKVQNIFENKFVNQITKSYFMFQQNKMYMIHTRYQLFMIIKEIHEYVLWSTMSIQMIMGYLHLMKKIYNSAFYTYFKFLIWS